MKEATFQAPETLDRAAGGILHAAVKSARPRRDTTVVLNLGETTGLDLDGGGWLIAISEYARSRHAELRIDNVREEISELYKLIEPGLAQEDAAKPTRSNLLESIGGAAMRVGGEISDLFRLLVESIYWICIGPIFDRRKFRWNAFLDEMHEMGVRAIIISCLMNFMLGLVIAMLSAAQLRQLGMGILVADLLVIAFTRELAALMTATVVSARTGAAIAAELATMKVQEEIDALRGMGFNITQFLIAPKVLALLVCMPCLVALGMLSGILGGTFWGVVVMGFDIKQWLIETMNAATLDDVIQGFSKCLCYAVTIALVGCHNGMRVTGGSRGVGLMTTRAVVMDVFLIVLIDMLFAAFFYFTM